jgi:hypothetical protein
MAGGYSWKREADNRQYATGFPFSPGNAVYTRHLVADNVILHCAADKNRAYWSL